MISHMPDLYINWLSRADNIHIQNDAGIDLIAELCIQEVHWYLHKLDIEPTLYHEFTHIWDMIEIRKVGNIQEIVHPCLSELHAAYVEFRHRLHITGAEKITLKTEIPVCCETESVETYLNNIKDDICDSLKNLTTSHDLNIIPHIWKQTQYLCADLCYIQQECDINPPLQLFTSILPDLFVPIMDAALKIWEDSSLIVCPSKHIQNDIKFAYDKLLSIAGL